MSTFALFRRRNVRFAGPIACALVLGTSAAYAQGSQQPTMLGTFNDWGAVRDTSGSNPVCYIGSVPKKTAGAYTQRGNTYVQVTHRPATKSFDVVSITAGYTYQPHSQVEVTIDGKDFVLYTDGGLAWVEDEAGDAELVEAMRRGKQMIVKGTSSRGTLTTDTYSLAGFTAARNAIDKACPRK
jgi:hypothetical protein